MYSIQEEFDVEILRMVAERGKDELEKYIRAQFEPYVESIVLDITGEWPESVIRRDP